MAAAQRKQPSNKLRMGDTGGVEAVSRKAVALLKEGISLHRRGDFAGAEELYRKAIDCRPKWNAISPAYGNLANLLARQGKGLEATGFFIDALQLQPSSDATFSNLGGVFLRCGLADRGLWAYSMAVAIQPDNPVYQNNLGSVHERSGRLRAASICYGHATDASKGTFTPLESDSWINLSNIRRAEGRLDDAFLDLLRAIGGARSHGRGYASLGAALAEVGRLQLGLLAYQIGLALNPDYPEIRSAFLFALSFSEYSQCRVSAEHKRFDSLHFKSIRRNKGHAFRRNRKSDRLRIGYVSPDFRWHPGGHFLLPHVVHHDRQNTEVFCYATSARRDHVSGKFKEHAEYWRDVAGYHREALCANILEDGIDILVECTGHLSNNVLGVFAAKPAPLQVSFPLYPETTGLSTIDYRFGDMFFSPKGCDEYYAEKLVRLPEVHVCYMPVDNNVHPSPSLPFARTGRFTFASFNNVSKLNDETITAWAEILIRVPGSRLLVKWRGMDGVIGGGIKRKFLARGVHEDQIETLGWSPDPYSPYLDVDLCLDPMGSNGGTTTCDALWMGVPVLTRYGERPFSRVGLCHLTAAGMPEMITSTVEEYVDLAVALATKPDRVDAMRKGLRQRVQKTPLMNTKRYAMVLDFAYQAIWERHEKGQLPESITISAGTSPATPGGLLFEGPFSAVP